MLLGDFVFNFLVDVEEAGDGAKKVPRLSRSRQYILYQISGYIEHTFIKTPFLSN